MNRTVVVVAAVVSFSVAQIADGQRGDVVVERYQSLEQMPPELRHRVQIPHRLAGTDSDAAARLRGGERPVIMLTGYWPPTNEMLRQFSRDPVKNPDGWMGSDFEGRGYDVVSFFPEFEPPDCDNCGQGTGELEVDYQDTSVDFWDFANTEQPIAIITFSRGFIDFSWEVEMNQFNRSVWINDFTFPLQPTPAPPDPSVPAGTLRPSVLPVTDIVDDVNGVNLGLNPFICFTGDGGGFLSEFAAYHGVWYQGIHSSPADPAWCVTAGHVHVGGLIDWDTAETAAEVTLRAVMDTVDTITSQTVCQPDLGFGGPGTAELRVCGDALAAGGVADLRLSGAPANSTAFLFVGLSANPTPFKGGEIVPLPAEFIIALPTDDNGDIAFNGIQGGGGPATLHVQFLYADGLQPQGIGFSNAVAMEFLP